MADLSLLLAELNAKLAIRTVGPKSGLQQLHSSTTGGAKESTLGSYSDILLVGLCASLSAVCLEVVFFYSTCVGSAH